MLSSPADTSIYDAANFARLRQQVTGSGASAQAGQRAVAQQFEGLMLQMMLQRMRAAVPQGGLLDSSQMRLIQSLHDDQLAQQLAQPGMGLANALLRQMQSNQPGAAMPMADGQDAGASASDWAPLAQPMSVQGQVSARSVTQSPAAALMTAIRAGATGAASLPARLNDVPAHVSRFVSRLGESAQAVAQASGLPVKLILAQAALESGWGQREIRHADGRTSHNLFGIKATGQWSGDVADVLTTEYENGEPRKLVQRFRAYDSYEDAFADHARLLTQSPRYAEVREARHPHVAARALQSAGYATDPAYADKLIRVMAQLPAGL